MENIGQTYVSTKFVEQHGKINVITSYEPHVACSIDDTVTFCKELDGVIRVFCEDDQVIIGANLNRRLCEEGLHQKCYHRLWNQSNHSQPIKYTLCAE